MGAVVAVFATTFDLHGPGVDQIIASEDETIGANGEVRWALADHEGTVRDVIDSAGSIENHIEYDSFGNITAESDDTVEFRYSYTGRELDAETGLYYYRARYYDPATARFIGEDPLGLTAGDVNVYRYVGNNPMTMTDPSGLCWSGTSYSSSYSSFSISTNSSVNSAEYEKMQTFVNMQTTFSDYMTIKTDPNIQANINTYYSEQARLLSPNELNYSSLSAIYGQAEDKFGLTSARNSWFDAGTAYDLASMNAYELSFAASSTTLNIAAQRITSTNHLANYRNIAGVFNKTIGPA